MVKLVGASSHNRRVAGSILGQGTYLHCSFHPRSGLIQDATDQCEREKLQYFCLSISHSKSYEKMSLGENKKEKNDRKKHLKSMYFSSYNCAMICYCLFLHRKFSWNNCVSCFKFPSLVSVECVLALGFNHIIPRKLLLGWSSITNNTLLNKIIKPTFSPSLT